MLGSLIGAGASLLSGFMGNSAAKKAAEAQARATQQAIDTQNQMFRTIGEKQEPFRQEGLNALRDINNPEAFQASPGYQFSVDQGQQAIERSAAARGGLNSGNMLAELSRYGTGVANQEYGNWWDRTMQRVGVGQSATNALSGAGQASANNISNALIGGGNARASGIMGGADAIANGLGGAAGFIGYGLEQRNNKNSTGSKNALGYNIYGPKPGTYA
jgi:hypothetical protein